MSNRIANCQNHRPALDALCGVMAIRIALVQRDVRFDSNLPVDSGKATTQ